MGHLGDEALNSFAINLQVILTGRTRAGKSDRKLWLKRNGSLTEMIAHTGNGKEGGRKVERGEEFCQHRE